MKKYSLYAIGEIVLVVLGILIALQINNWNEERKNRKKEEQFLQQIHKEFVENRKQMDKVINRNMLVYKKCKWLSDRFPLDLKTHPVDSIQTYLKGTQTWGMFNPSQGSIDALISTSSFDIISNDRLRALLIQWRDLVNDLKNTQMDAMEQLRLIYKPYMMKNWALRGKLLNDPRVDLSFLTTLEFENQLHSRMGKIQNILFEGRLNEVEEAMVEIIFLSQSK